MQTRRKRHTSEVTQHMASLFGTRELYDNYVGVSRGVRLLDQHPLIPLGSVGGRVVTFSVVNNEATIAEVEAFFDNENINAFRANKDNEWVTKQVERLFSDEITDEEDGEKITYSGDENYTDKSKYSDRQSIERDVRGPATLEQRGRDDRAYFLAFSTELRAST